ncbi:MAG TPA: lipopolysaccharide biosynthesis protein [Solirubrobacterales bacterium]
MTQRFGTFTRGFISTFTLDIASRGMGALTTVLLLRALPVDGFAYIVFFLNIGQFFGSAATGGLRIRYTRMEAERVSRGVDEPSAFHVTLRNGVILIVAAALVSLGGAFALGIGGSDHERLVFIALGTAFTIGAASIELAIFHYQAQLAFFRAGRIAVARNGILLVVAALATVGLVDSGQVVGLYFAIATNLVALFVAAPLALETRHTKATSEGRFGFGRESAALTLYSLVSSGWAYLDIFLVAALLNSASVAAYGAALRYISIVTGPMPSLVSVLRIRTTQHDMIDSAHAQIELMSRWLRQTIVPAVVLLVVAAVAAIWVIPIVNGGRYPESVGVFQVLLVAACAQFVTLPNSGLLITQERYTTLAWTNALVVALNIPLAAVAAPLFGVVGVAAVGSGVGVFQVALVSYLAAHPPELRDGETEHVVPG